MALKLISEPVEEVKYITEVIEEGEHKKERLFINGIFAQADVVNRNKRVYPLSILENEVNRFIKEDIKNNRAIGELGHPDSPTIHHHNSCIKITSLLKEGKNFTGKALVLSTPSGKIVEALINDGVSLGVSTRALGSVKPMREDVNEVQNDLRLITVDIVHSPSAPGAYVNGVLESKEWVYENGMLVEQLVETHKKIIQHSKSNEKLFLRLFEEFLSKIK